MDTEQNKNLENQPEVNLGEAQESAPIESATMPEAENIPEQTISGEEVMVENGQVFQAPPHDDANTDVASHVEHIAPLPEEEKLWQLKLIARDQNLLKAIEVAKKLDDPWLEDKFHDDLMDDPELRVQLEELGKIEKL